jgi:hypothetical protein
LEFRGPEAGNEPECEDAEDWDGVIAASARRPHGWGTHSEGGDKDRKREEQDSRAVGERRMGEQIAHAEGERGGEQRRAAEKERLDL